MKKLSDFEFAMYLKKANKLIDAINSNLDVAYEAMLKETQKAA